MALVSPNLALILFGLILIISGCIAWFMKKYDNYDRSGFHSFISILTGLGVFVTFMFYYNVVELQNQQQQLAAIQELARLNESGLNSVLDSLNIASSSIPNFVLSLMPLNINGCNTKKSDPVTPQTCTEKTSLSYKIFLMWQDVILSNKFIVFNQEAYLSNFLQRANSPQLYEQWKIIKIDFAPATQTLGDLLFQYGLPITVQTPETYQETAKTLMTDPKYQAIFN